MKSLPEFDLRSAITASESVSQERLEWIRKLIDENAALESEAEKWRRLADKLASEIIRSAKKSIVLIDNYMDENTIALLSKKNKGVSVLLLSKNVHKPLIIDVQKANDQFGNFEIKSFYKSHDRFLIIDESDIYHLGASLKDLGKKWFAFSKLDKNSVDNILKSIVK